MGNDLKFKKDDITVLQKLLKQNKEIDFKKINFNDTEKLESSINWKDIKDKNKVITILKAYQRLLRILPGEDNDTAIELLKVNIHSATQIANLTKRDFIKNNNKIFKGKEEIGNKIYENALKKRSRLVVQYMNILQNNEPHVKASKV